MNWKRLLIAMATKRKYNAFIADTKKPEVARKRLWQDEILPLLRQSIYWPPLLKTKKSLNLEEFSITTYDDYEKELLSAQQGNIQPFNGEQLIFWSETSGTAGVRKFFPLTASFQKQFQRTMPPYIYNLTQQYPGFFKEKVLYLVAVDANKTTPGGIPSGWISNFNYRHLPGFLKQFYAMPIEVFAHSDLYEQWAPLYALASDVSAVFAVTPMVITAFYERCTQGFAHYLPYLLGEKALPNYLPELKINRARIDYLKSLAGESQLTYKELWPSLVLAGCWTSGLCAYPAQQLKMQLGDDIGLVDGTYSATEGWLTVPLETNLPGGILHPGAHIVEFIEEGKEINTDNLLQSWELEQDKTYEVFLTTAMGFVRYQLKDIVRCMGYFNRAPRLEFCSKTQVLKLESCAITGQELQQMLKSMNFKMEAHWYFARNSLGNRIVLVTDDSTQIPETLLNQFHECLILISETYAHSVETGEVLPMVLHQLSLKELSEDNHAQSKPKLISQQVVTVR